MQFACLSVWQSVTPGVFSPSVSYDDAWNFEKKIEGIMNIICKCTNYQDIPIFSRIFSTFLPYIFTTF